MDSMKTKSEELIRNKMSSEGMSQTFIQDFLKKTDQVRNGETGMVRWEEVGDLDPVKDEITLERIEAEHAPDPEILKNLVVIKLNGGLGTSMGLSGPKSLIPLKDGMSFLEIFAKQSQVIQSKYNVSVPLILMDSFNTQKESQAELKRIGFSQKFATSFLQHKVPRILKEDLTPISCQNPDDEWCPPGHGDIWISLLETGLLDTLIENGYKIAFVSNGDNLGATVHPGILSYMLKEKLEFCMEMTPKTLADKKGGAIYRRIVNGKPENYQLLETAQVPADHMHEFEGLGKFRTFSTNNLWIDLVALKERILQGNFELSLIVNPKTVEGKEVLQLETAMGSAIRNFNRVKGIIIPRDRFAPVKKCEDYLVRRSDAYHLRDDYSITMSEERKKSALGEVLISLDDKFYKKIQDFNRLFPEIPSLVRCTSLQVKGEVLFDRKITIVGDVTIENNGSSPRKISELNLGIFESGKYSF
ncbi:nucleotide glucose-1-phosphate uridylyl transferase [Leptospira yasudae]|uniref:Nucleotide glucose-1-phosphate uridylyl transferase n=1 Tax=Leptospira yasudae TaxID=2202201 RepID=A0ABX9M0B7_9LEPT|nr:UTP--glucose-1-phosphate uridylyltransferase [Leptospira yasudae]RHX78709.1 nucleotide glucose-1-phosphate uridylyl transferase [Leptospira yasudae]RHX91363.1 nucleotide glucose-1-phosphate uridylyl transferase [Leptospira yasudae]TGK27817.1 UTP--glucose-1-phosphate uridylyltransferase [Leptospira yasudae]TGM06942.1 UTP--glucose-1-phosphate uridylyltransferase [Leptospira yasudae]